MLQETIDAIWESSRLNGWSFAVPLVLNIGTAILIVIALVSVKWLRWILYAATISAMVYLAVEYSFMEIEEKWRIRREWMNANWQSLTPRERSAGTADGANRVLGPIVVGGQAAIVRAFIVLICVTLGRFLVGRLRQTSRRNESLLNTLEPVCSTMKADPSNPYAPPVASED